MMKRLSLSILVSLALAACTNNADRPAAAPQLSEETLRSATQTLSSDAYEGRAPTTHGEELAVAYISDQFRRAGLRPGNHGGWFQNVPVLCAHGPT